MRQYLRYYFLDAGRCAHLGLTAIFMVVTLLAWSLDWESLPVVATLAVCLTGLQVYEYFDYRNLLARGDFKGRPWLDKPE